MIEVLKTADGEYSDTSELMRICMDIIETFEYFLDERGIVIENSEKQQDPDGACNIYGSDYGELETAIGDILYSYGLVEEKQ